VESTFCNEEADRLNHFVENMVEIPVGDEEIDNGLKHDEPLAANFGR
jgi:hypothetical protein